jgi:hypothetical protein
VCREFSSKKYTVSVIWPRTSGIYEACQEIKSAVTKIGLGGKPVRARLFCQESDYYEVVACEQLFSLLKPKGDSLEYIELQIGNLCFFADAVPFQGTEFQIGIICNEPESHNMLLKALGHFASFPTGTFPSINRIMTLYQNHRSKELSEKK